MSWFEAPSTLLPDLILAHGKWRGSRPALIEGDLRLTWGEFAAQTAQVANGLRAAGLRHGERVALLMDNSLELAVVLFGVLRSGCVAVPLNVAVSDSAVAAMIEDAAARAVFASGSHCQRIETISRTSVQTRDALRFSHGYAGAGWLDFTPWREAQPSEQPQVAIGPEDECNIIYSSGTTGTPKGIVHTHRCRMNWATEMAAVLRYRSDSVALFSLGLFSNISWVSMLASVLCGGAMVVMRSFTPTAALEVIAREGVSHGNFVPVQLQQFLDLGQPAPQTIATLRTLMVCGAPIRLEVKQRFQQQMGCELIELYGLTEGFCTILAPEDFAEHKTSVGKPFLGGDLRIIDEEGREMAPGQVGEIVGFSPLMMRGYHNREDASREATWTDAQGRRWLRTGDLGFVDGQGFLFVVDRKKDMILSGGQNIYPADIEQVMRQHPAVADVAVVAARSGKWGETPVAIVVVHDGAGVERQELMNWTNARVGKQQRIADIFWHSALPRNPAGKVLKRQLRSEISDREY